MYQGRAFGGGVLTAMPTVDAVPLYQLVGRWVGPEVIGRLGLGILQSTGAHYRSTDIRTPDMLIKA